MGSPCRVRRECLMERALIGRTAGDIVLVGEHEIEICSIGWSGSARSQWPFRVDEGDFENAQEVSRAATYRRCGRRPWSGPGALRHLDRLVRTAGSGSSGIRGL